MGCANKSRAGVRELGWSLRGQEGKEGPGRAEGCSFRPPGRAAAVWMKEW